MDSFAGAVTQNLQCPICLTLINEPKLLSCSHNVCESCLTKQLLLASKSSSIACPVCRYTTDTPEGGVSNLPTNRPLKAITLDIRRRGNFCSVCNRESKRSEYCSDCERVMCKGCRKDHDGWKPNLDHSVVALNKVNEIPVESVSKVYCEEHPLEKRECTDICITCCQKYICERCRLFNHAKKGHTVQSVVDYEAERHSLKAETESKKVANSEESSQNSKHGIETGIDVDLVKELPTNGSFVIGQSRTGTQYVCVRLNEIRGKVNGKDSYVKNVSELNLKEFLASTIGMCREVKQVPIRDDTSQGTKEQSSITKSLVSEPIKILGQVSSVITWEQFSSCHFHQGVQLLAPNSMECMVTTPHGRLAIGCSPGGIEVFSPDARSQERVLRDVKVRGLGFLSDGRYVVRDQDNMVSLYSTGACEKDDVRFKTLSDDEGGHGGLAVGINDDIFVGYRKAKKIQEFTSRGGEAIREIPCDGYEPMQIFAMRSNKMLLVKSSLNSVHVVDEFGLKRHELVKDVGNIVHPALGSSDTIIVATLSIGTNMVTIERYTRELELQSTILSNEKVNVTNRKWYGVQELSSGKVAFCTPDRLYMYAPD